LLGQKGLQINALLLTRSTPLYMAARNGHADVVRMLVKAGARVNDVHKGVSALYVAAAGGYTEVVRVLLEDGHASVDSRNPEDSSTPLFIAAQQGHAEIVKLLIEHGANVNITTADGRSPLFLASYRGHDAVVKLLLQAKADCTTSFQDGTPFHIACFEGHEKVVRTFLAYCPSVNTPTTSGVSPYYIATKKGHHGVARAIKFATQWQRIRLLWIGRKKNDRSVDPSELGACLLPFLPKELVEYIQKMVLRDADMEMEFATLSANSTVLRTQSEQLDQNMEVRH